MKDIDGSLLIIAGVYWPYTCFSFSPKKWLEACGFLSSHAVQTATYKTTHILIIASSWRILPASFRGGVAFHWLCNIFQSMFVSRGRINSRPIGKYRHHWMRRLSKGLFLPNPGRLILPICLIQFSCNFPVSFFRQAIAVWASIADIQQLSQRDPKRVLSWELGLIIIRVSIYSSLVMGYNFRGSF